MIKLHSPTVKEEGGEGFGCSSWVETVVNVSVRREAIYLDAKI